MSGRRLEAFWLEFADAAGGPLSRCERGPLSPSAVRHENRDLVLATWPSDARALDRANGLANWQAYWERQTGQKLIVRRLGGTFEPVH